MDQNQENNTSPIKKSSSDISTPNSILIGAIIISISIFSAAYMITKGGLSTGTLGQGSSQTSPLPGSQVKVTDRSDQAYIGSKLAPVTMYEFGDFQCLFCKKFFQESFGNLKTKYIDTGKVRLVFRHFPITQIHNNAEIASEAAECANRQGQFEAYYSILYTQGQGDGTGLDLGSLKKYASQIGLNTTTFNQCLDNHETKSVVTADEALGSSLGVTGTPAFFIDGQLILGAQPLDVFIKAIEVTLKK